MSDSQTELADEVQSKLRHAEAELAKLQERFADFNRELDAPTRTIDRTIPDPVIVTSEMIQQLWAILEAGPGRPVMVCVTTDGRITSWRTLPAALKQANASDKQIEAINIGNELATAKAQVRLYPTKVTIHVYAEETDAERLFADLEEAILTGLRGTPGYRWFATHCHSAVRAGIAALMAYAALANLDSVAALGILVVDVADSRPLAVAVGAFVVAVWSYPDFSLARPPSALRDPSLLAFRGDRDWQRQATGKSR